MYYEIFSVSIGKIRKRLLPFRGIRNLLANEGRPFADKFCPIVVDEFGALEASAHSVGISWTWSFGTPKTHQR